MRLRLLPLLLLGLTGASYGAGILMVFNPYLKPMRGLRVEDSSGRPAYPLVDTSGVYSEEREICSGPQAGRAPTRACASETVLSAECPRCVDGRCQSPTGFSVSIPGESWRFVGFPGFRCVDPQASCRRFLETGPGQVEFNASTERITAEVFIPGPPDSVRLCATARYYPPWNLDDLNRELTKAGQPPIPSPRDIYLGRYPSPSAAASAKGVKPPDRGPPANR
jgi:hypothetical protein